MRDIGKSTKERKERKGDILNVFMEIKVERKQWTPWKRRKTNDQRNGGKWKYRKYIKSEKRKRSLRIKVTRC